MKFRLSVLVLITAKFELLWAASPAEEFILDRVYVPEESAGELFDISDVKIKRLNRTSFSIGGDILLKEEIDDTVWVKVSIIGVDAGGDKYLFTREREKICSYIMEVCEHCRNIIDLMKFDPKPEKCPFEKQKYNMPPFYIKRLRQDWPLVMRVTVPPFVPFENYKIDMQFFREGKQIDHLIVAFRLTNKFSAT
ncbi:uncharacterized protein LOC134832238 [Culicoides brevitarsis]|uniref:uncharacterized protein LOC134832238 n=1 Tax=Culicoides brevitarsis TaxID=469753 RepID=UPI00307B8ED2